MLDAVRRVTTCAKAVSVRRRERGWNEVMVEMGLVVSGGWVFFGSHRNSRPCVSSGREVFFAEREHGWRWRWVCMVANQVVVCTAPPRTMAWKSPQSVNPGNRRPCKLPAVAGMVSSGKTTVTLPVPPPPRMQDKYGNYFSGLLLQERAAKLQISNAQLQNRTLPGRLRTCRGCEGVAVFAQ